MEDVEQCSPTRVLFTHEELISLDKDQLLQHWTKQDCYINWMESQLSSSQIGFSHLRELEEKLRVSISSECARRENALLMRLNSKEQEIQDLMIQIQELKASQASSPTSLRTSLLDPAVNVLIKHLRQELNKAKTSLEETQNELSAWKFTPDSNTGKRLMAKCRLLYQENEELGRMISSGRLAKLEGELALQRNFSEEMKKSQSELDEFLLELDEDVEGMQSTIYFLQQQLRQTRDQLAAVQKDNEMLRNSSIDVINIKPTNLPLLETYVDIREEKETSAEAKRTDEDTGVSLQPLSNLSASSLQLHENTTTNTDLDLNSLDESASSNHFQLSSESTSVISSQSGLHSLVPRYNGL